jgi:nicotinate (nicotinamide) nucleotide adenylyltransferase
VDVARQLAALAWVDQVLIVPAAQSPFKRQRDHLPPALRYRMARESFSALPKTAVLDWEIVRPPPSYTLDTVIALRHAFPRARLWLALGSDVFAGFADWHGAGRILDHAGLLVFPRAQEADGNRPASVPHPRLPPPWHRHLTPDAEGQLVDPAGRPVVRFVPFDVPALSASRIASERDLSQVPSGARELLAEYWRQPGPPPAP